MQTIYTAEATTAGEGRAGGHGRTSDGALEVRFCTPKEFGGAGGEGTNPEQLVALGYAACFRSALGVVAARENIRPGEGSVTCRTNIGKTDQGDFALSFEITADFPELSQAEADLLVAEAHQVCPYSRAFRDGAEVKVVARGRC